MKAVQFHSYGGPEVLRYEEVVAPIPKENELLIRVHAVGVNPLDWKVRAGSVQLPIIWRIRDGGAPLLSADALPFIPGFDVAGVVEAAGAAVESFMIGDEVYGMPTSGGYAEYVAVPARDVAHKPRTLDFVQAAAIPSAAVNAWQGLFEVIQLAAGQTLLIHGAAGGIGTFAVQLAKWRGATVIGTASGDNVAYLRQLGIDEAIDYTKTRFENVVSGVDAILDLVGGETQQRSWPVLKAQGVLATVGGPLSHSSAEANPPHFHVYNTLRPVGQQLVELACLVDGGHLTPFVSTVLPLHEAAKAHLIIQSRHTRGKTVLQVIP
jgi:NADPH:quinone reductase-like Zn-dependent oxidoreductase